jgi:metallo-beta-lactamase class B
MKSGKVSADDPQFGVLLPLAPVANVQTVKDGQILTVGPVKLTAHSTPGHTPGGTSWTWQSCEGGRCVELLYMDSTTPVSAPGFKYTTSTKYKTGIQDFEKSIAFLKTVKCGILVTAHPEASGLWDRLAARERTKSPEAMVDEGACKALAGRAEVLLKKRIADEGAQ